MNTTRQDFSREKILWAAIIPQIALLVISIIWIYVSPKDNVLKYLAFNYKTILFGILVGILLALLGYLFYLWALKSKKFSEIVDLFQNVLSPVFKNLKLIDIVLLSLVAGFCEELFFRGLLLPRLGIILSSIAFGMLHLPGFKYWLYVLWATLSGALLGWLFLLTQSLWSPIIAHATNNLIGMIMLKKLKSRDNS